MHQANGVQHCFETQTKYVRSPAAREARRSWGAVPVVPWGGTGGAAGGPAAC